jgi:heptosyltransferase-1
MMKALLVKTSSLGDIVHTFPVVGYLKHLNVTIDWVVETSNAALPLAHPHVNQVLTIDSKKWRKNPLNGTTWNEIASLKEKLRAAQYDVVFDLQGNIKSGIVTWLTPCHTKVGFGKATVPEWPNLLATNHRFNPLPGNNIRADYLSLVQSYFGDRNPFENTSVILKVSDDQKRIVRDLLASPVVEKGSKILVCSGSMWTNKTLPAETLLRLLQRIHETFDCSYLLAWGSEEEKTTAEFLSKNLNSSLLLPRLPLPTLQNLMHGVDLTIAMDSLPLHLAGTACTPTWGLFGPSSVAKYNPQGPQNLAFQGACPYGRSFEKRCPILRTCPTGACLREQSSEALFKQFETWASNYLARH